MLHHGLHGTLGVSFIHLFGNPSLMKKNVPLVFFLPHDVIDELEEHTKAEASSEEETRRGFLNVTPAIQVEVLGAKDIRLLGWRGSL
jgi:hypothetical protein